MNSFLQISWPGPEPQVSGAALQQPWSVTAGVLEEGVGSWGSLVTIRIISLCANHFVTSSKLLADAGLPLAAGQT